MRQRPLLLVLCLAVGGSAPAHGQLPTSVEEILAAVRLPVVATQARTLATFDNIGQILLVPAAFLLANLIQANIVTTLVLGRRLALNPVALFVGLAFWFWIWGIAGAFIGVPLLAIFKIICDNIESLAPVGEFLGARAEPAPAPALPADQAAS